MASERENMTEEPKELTQDEELLITAQIASKVKTTLETPGWKEVIRPYLDGRREYYTDRLLSEQGRMEDVVYAQQNVLAIKELLKEIDFVLSEGKHAGDYFKQKGKEEEND